MLVFHFIDLTDSRLWYAIVYIFLNLFAWLLIPYLEFQHKLFSKLLKGDYEKAADFVAYFLIYLGTMRNYYMQHAIYHNYRLDLGRMNYPLFMIGILALGFGALLILTSFYRLGIRGLYFGDHFGTIRKERITNFPYDIIVCPHYVGSILFQFGITFCYRSPAACVFTILYMLSYSILDKFEEKKFEEKKFEIFNNDEKKTVENLDVQNEHYKHVHSE